MLGMLISMLILAFLLYVSYYDINKEAKKRRLDSRGWLRRW